MPSVLMPQWKISLGAIQILGYPHESHTFPTGASVWFWGNGQMRFEIPQQYEPRPQTFPLIGVSLPTWEIVCICMDMQSTGLPIRVMPSSGQHCGAPCFVRSPQKQQTYGFHIGPVQAATCDGTAMLDKQE